MSQHLLSQQVFNGGVVLNAANPGGLGHITTGSITPHLADTTGGALFAGVMPDADFKSYVDINISNGQSACILAVVRLKDFGANASLQGIFEVLSNTNLSAQVGWNSAGLIATFDGGAGTTNGTLSVTLNDWILVAFIVRKNGDNSTEFTVKLGVNGGAVATAKTRAAFFDGFTSLNRLGFVNYSGDGTSNWRGHVAYVGVFTTDNYPADADYPAGISLPTKAKNTWKMVAGGSLSNSGKQSSPWPLSTSKFVSEVMDGIFEGDEIIIDSSAGAWDIGANVVDIHLARGFTMTFIGEPRPWKDRTGAASGGTQIWTAHDASVWKFSDTDLTNTILYLNDAPMATHPVGVNLAAVIAALDSTVGSFWTDGATMYANFGFNPNTTAGKTIVTSRDRTYNYDLAPGTHGAPVFHYTNCGGDFVINDLKCRYTGYISPTDNNLPFEGDCVRSSVGCKDFTLALNRVNWDHFGKHAYTYAVDAPTRARINFNDSTLGRGVPYVAFGGWTSLALFVATAGTGDCQATITNCLSTDSTGQPFLIVHGGGGVVDQFSSVLLTRVSASKQQITNQGVALNVTLNDCIVGSLTQSPAKTMTMNRGRLYGGISGGGLTLSNVLWTPSENLSAANTNVQVSGTINLFNATVDVSGCTVGDSSASLLYRVGVAAITIAGSAWKFGGKDIATVANAAAGEITANDNVYEKPVGNRLYETFNTADRTGTAAQGLGLDVNSQFVADLKLQPDFEPRFDSAARAAVSLARWPAFASTLDARRRRRNPSGTTDAGAMQYRPPAEGRLGMSCGIGV
jgi:hypothetical protein